jgi:hypothetical protein
MLYIIYLEVWYWFGVLGEGFAVLSLNSVVFGRINRVAACRDFFVLLLLM